jgi:hypothetical protein
MKLIGVRNVIYACVPSVTTITVFLLVFISNYMIRPVYNGHLKALARGGVLRIVYTYYIATILSFIVAILLYYM